MIARVEIELAGTKSYAVRKVTITRYTKAGYKVSALIDLVELKTVTSKPHDRTFVLEEQAFDGGRVFRLYKDFRRRLNEDPYYTVTLYRDGYARCTCKGFEHHGHCGHVDAVRAAGENFQLPKHPGLPYYTLFDSHNVPKLLKGSQ